MSEDDNMSVTDIFNIAYKSVFIFGTSVVKKRNQNKTMLPSNISTYFEKDVTSSLIRLISIFFFFY